MVGQTDYILYYYHNISRQPTLRRRFIFQKLLSHQKHQIIFRNNSAAPNKGFGCHDQNIEKIRRKCARSFGRTNLE